MRIRTCLTYLNDRQADSLSPIGARFRLRRPQKPSSVVSAIQGSIPAKSAESLLSKSVCLRPPDLTQSNVKALNFTIVLGLHLQQPLARLPVIGSGPNRTSRLHQCLQLDSELAEAGDLTLVHLTVLPLHISIRTRTPALFLHRSTELRNTYSLSL